jgi:nitrate/nitrite transport system substrate-binding protein
MVTALANRGISRRSSAVSAWRPSLTTKSGRTIPEKVFGVTAEWDKKNPNTHIAVVKALIRAGKWLDASPENRKKACEILSKPEYVGADYKVIANSMTGTWEYHKGDVRPMPDFNVFFRYYATYPFYSDCIWYLTQMRRWGQITEAKSDDWYFDTAKEVYKPETYLKAAEALISEGKVKETKCQRPTASSRPRRSSLTASNTTAKKPNDYLKQFPIGLKD